MSAPAGTAATPLPLPPEPEGAVAWRALAALLRGGGTLGALESLRRDLGPVFQIPLPGFRPIMLSGPEANRFMLVEAAGDLRWRVEQDPVGRLFRDGLLMLDGERHDGMRRLMAPALHKRMVEGYVSRIVRQVDRVSARWPAGGTIDALVEMRRIALLSLVDTLFGVDAGKDMARLWRPVLKTLAYISPGPWLVWRDIPRPGYRRSLRRMDAYLYAIIRARRRAGLGGGDLLGLLIEADLPDDLIRDQLITMLVAGHDTSTALLAWTLALLGRNPAVLRRAQAEVGEVLGDDAPTAERLEALPYLGQVIDETLRLYPPIHLGNRTAAADLEFGGYRIPAGRRVLYSIYLAHRDPAHWPDPARFDPERFSAANKRGRAPYTYLPFGGGRRNCIGYAFAEVEVRVVLARLLQRFELARAGGRVRAHMGATLEPRPGVPLRVARRGGAR